MDFFEKVMKFREAIDMAKDDRMFEGLVPFNNFPRECCEHASDLLAQYLSEQGIMTKQIKGTCRYDENWHHVWLLTEDDIVIDITGDQFTRRIPQLKGIPDAVYIGKEGEVQKIFGKNKKIQLNTNFVDENEFTDFNNQPNAYQKRLIEIYEIIRKYINNRK